jgi:peptide/nickel transport system ATP-binding protein
MLELSAISKVYRIGTFGGEELRAVSDVSFNVKDREVMALIGESGSGKSTIGKMILRLITTNSGSILFNNVDVATLKGPALKEYYRKVQGVFQDPFSSYNPVFKADRLFATIHQEFYPAVNDREWKAKIDDSLRAVGLNPPDVLDKYPHQLSGGQLQRFLIARALLLDIDFLVADEVISMLDASTRIDVLNVLADLKSRGLSILFITHDLSLGYYISERAVILYRGCVAELGSTKKIFENPLHPYTKMLMASVARLDQKWGKEGGEIELQGPQSPLSRGCVYYGRCPVAIEKCASYRPPLLEVETEHSVACVHYTGEQAVKPPTAA